jgi:hypothetical protein
MEYEPKWCHCIPFQKRLILAISNLLCPGWAKVLHNLLWSVTPYLDLALIFLLFRFSLRIRFFLHCNIITYLVMKGPQYQTLNEWQSFSPGSICCHKIMWRLQSQSMENFKDNKTLSKVWMISLHWEMKIVNIWTLINFLVRFPHYTNIITNIIVSL